MIDRTMRALGMMALGFAIASMVGCSDDNTADCEDSTDCALGASCVDGECKPNFVPECVIDLDCDAGQICEDNACQVGCRDNDGCSASQVCINNTCRAKECDGSADCDPGNRCVSGQCVPVSQCTAVGQTCNPTVATNDGFVCVDQGNGPVCAQSCEEQVACLSNGAASQRRTCPQGSICENSACLPSNCDPARVNADCELLTQANPALYPAGSTCQKVIVQLSSDGDSFKTDDDQNYAYRCTAPGTVARDGACGVAGGLGQPPSACVAGLKCISDEYLNGVFTQGNRVCEIPCNKDQDCPSGETCLGEQANRFDGAGVCGVACKPFDVDPEACPGGTCMPIGDNDGRCLNTGATGGDLPYAECTGNGANCPSGTVCLSGQCTPLCDPTRKNQPERDDTCFHGEPTAYARFLHLASEAGPVDIYVDNKKVADDLAFDAVAAGDGGWYELEPGLHEVDIVAGTASNNQRPLLTRSITLERNTGTNFFVVPGAGATPIRLTTAEEARFVTAPAANRTMLRVTNAAVGVGEVDVVLTTPDADVTLPNRRTLVGAGLALGEVSEYTARAVGTVDVYIFPVGGPYTQVDALAVFQDYTIAAAQRTNLVVYGAPDDGAALALKQLEHRSFKHIPSSGAYCYDLAGGNGAVSRPGWGVCLQRCNSAADYGTGACDAPNGACLPFGENISVCLGENGAAQLGGACDLDNVCGDGLFCDFKGDGTGICRSYCTLNGVENDDLVGCQAGETCLPSDLIPNLGECRVACQPAAAGDFKDTTRCPAGQQTCYPQDGNLYCHPSGSVAIGQSCVVNGEMADVCAPGSLCTRDATVEYGLEQLFYAFTNFATGNTASCRKVCRPFKADGEPSDCAADEACLPVLPSQDLNTAAGVCYPRVQTLSADKTICDPQSVGKMCDDGSLCQLTLETPPNGGNQCLQSGSCLQLCDYATQRGCNLGQRCVVNGGVGNRQLILGVYGICQDEN